MLRTFDPAKHIITFKGIVLLAPASGTYASVERHEDTFTYQYGAHGDMARVRNRKRGGRISITLMGISPTNDQLSTILALDEKTGLGFGTFQIQDLNGTTVVHATNAWIVRPPNYQVADEHSDREWMFDCDSVDMFIGGELT
jgi:hypothetical protein